MFLSAFLSFLLRLLSTDLSALSKHNNVFGNWVITFQFREFPLTHLEKRWKYNKIFPYELVVLISILYTLFYLDSCLQVVFLEKDKIVLSVLLFVMTYHRQYEEIVVLLILMHCPKGFVMLLYPEELTLHRVNLSNSEYNFSFVLLLSIGS